MSVHTLDWLVGGVTSFEGRVQVSLVQLAVLAGAAWLARYLRVRAESVEATRVANVGIATGLLAQETAEAADLEVEDVLRDPRPNVVLQGSDDSAITLDCRFWIAKPSPRRRWPARTAVVKAVTDAFDEAGIKIPFPEREHMGRQEAGRFRLGGRLGAAELGADVD